MTTLDGCNNREHPPWAFFMQQRFALFYRFSREGVNLASQASQEVGDEDGGHPDTVRGGYGCKGSRSSARFSQRADELGPALRAEADFSRWSECSIWRIMAAASRSRPKKEQILRVCSSGVSSTAAYST